MSELSSYTKIVMIHVSDNFILGFSGVVDCRGKIGLSNSMELFRPISSFSAPPRIRTSEEKELESHEFNSGKLKKGWNGVISSEVDEDHPTVVRIPPRVSSCCTSSNQIILFYSILLVKNTCHRHDF